jgi:predicted TIM-barrel fold metal-dependent hydrolase
MTMPLDIGVIDTMVGFPVGFEIYDFIRQQAKDWDTRETFQFPVEYLFKGAPKELYGADDPVSVVLHEMDRFGVERALIGCEGDVSRQALTDHPDRFIPSMSVDPNRGMDDIRKMVENYERFGIKAATAFPAGYVCAGVPGPRIKMACQHVELIDEVMYDFPDLTFVTRHGCEPWTDLAVKLMLKWPGLHYSTSAFAPKYYPRQIVDYANTRGADKIIYAGYFPMGLTLERIFRELPNVGFKDEVWPKFLRENAVRVLKL